ncbi:D-aminoacylase [Halieaceae bacterium IMCC14734]|uniref:D-aminoacylase n=1 Tax=Candidatus Litorirhabdus singularis TaxID=2518993 RepID=A0ABT3TDV6_9GAMM|nr:amidohydrolase family protein [Candidatus Litorirhabdus singularis]MCX2980439.1 D-aminoacylase [Candidatus Litorirhabdus singularis]
MTPQHNYLICGGTVVDGSGAAAFAADVRVRNGLITEVAPGLQPAENETVVDAAGCYVTPGLIESHTHFDGTMWWQPGLDPLPGCGVTTVVMGNCGFALAPLHDDAAVREQVVKIFSFFEDIPEEPFMTNLPWDWRRWSEYKDSMVKNVRVPTNYGTFVGHIALRLAVMGMEAWERAATADEIAEICELLVDALEAGALGMSTNLMDHDGDDRPVPSLQADDAEFSAIFDVMEKYPGTSVQVVIDSLMRMTAPQAMERLAQLTEGKAVRLQWAGVPTLKWQKDYGLQQPLLDLHERFAAEGRDFWTGYAHVPITVTASIRQSLLFAQSNDYVWHEVVSAETDAAKLALLADPDWRERARHSWDHESLETAFFRNPRPMMLDNSENEVGPMGITLGEYADQLGVHPSDALAEWFILNGLSSTITMPPWEKDNDTVVNLTRDPYAVGNINDSGAHGQLFCGAGDNLLLYTDYVRSGLLSMEEAVHSQTGKLADHFGFGDRGEIKVGKRADITVFALDEIERREKYKVYDVPDGQGGYTWRWTRDAAPMRLTLVNGVSTFAEGAPTGAFPGVMVSPGDGA